MITITPRDALRSETMEPGWQFCKIPNMYTKAAQSDGSTNYYYEIEVIDGKYKGVPLQDLVVNEKAVSMHKNFFIAAGAPPQLWEDAKKGEAQSFDERNPIGKVIKVMVTPTKFENRILNKPSDFLALNAEEAAKYSASV